MSEYTMFSDLVEQSGIDPDHFQAQLEQIVESWDLGPETDAFKALAFLKAQLEHRVVLNDKPH